MNILLEKMNHDSTELEDQSNELICKVTSLQTTLQLLGAKKLGELAKRMCDAAKRGTLLHHFNCYENKNKNNNSNTRTSSSSFSNTLEEKRNNAENTTGTNKNNNTVLEVGEPTLIEMFIREIFVMQRLIDAAYRSIKTEKANENFFLSVKEEEEEQQQHSRDHIDRRGLAA